MDQRFLDELLVRKREGQKLDRQPKITALSNFIESQLRRLEKIQVREREKPNFEKLNETFRTALD